MPSSSAVRMVFTASAWSVPPHIEPPIDQVPSPTRELISMLSASPLASIVVASAPSDAVRPLSGCMERPRGRRPLNGQRTQEVGGMEALSARNDTSARGGLTAQLAGIEQRLQNEGEIPPVDLPGGDFLDVAQGVEQQELARLVASRLTERARRLRIALTRLQDGDYGVCSRRCWRPSWGWRRLRR